MKLYYAPGACSLSADILAREAELPVDFEKVNLKDHTTELGNNYYEINPNGYVPVLELDSGEKIHEAAVVLAYIAAQNPDALLMPEEGSLEWYRTWEWLVFTSTELHKTFGPLHNPQVTPDARDAAITKLYTRFSFVNDALEGKEYLTGSQFTAADAYAYAILRWTKQFKIDITTYPHVENFLARVTARPHVQEALLFEGLS